MSNPVSPAEATASTSPDRIDFEAWRARIKADTFARYHLGMGDALLKVGSGGEAVEAYRRAVGVMPSLCEAQVKLVAALRQLGHGKEADVAHHAAITADAGYERKGWVDIGVQQLLAGETEDGARALAHGVAIGPDDQRSRLYHALALFATGDIDRAKAEFSAACDGKVVDAPQVAADYTTVGNRIYWYSDYRDWTMDASIAIADCAYRLDPDSDANAFALFYLEFLANHPERILLRADQDAPSRMQAFNVRGLVGWANLLCGRWADADRVLSLLLQQEPDPKDRGTRSFYVAGHAVAMQALGRVAEAKMLLDASIAKDKNDFNALRYRGLMALGEGNLNEANHFLEQAKTAGTHSPIHLADAGLCQMVQGNLDNAERLHRAALAQAGHKSRFVAAADPWLVLNLALVLWKKGGVQEALALYAAHVASHPMMMPYFLLLLPEQGRELVRQIQCVMEDSQGNNAGGGSS